MKVISFLTLAALLSISACSHHQKCCDKKEKCAKEHCSKDKDCKDGSCKKDDKKAKKS